MEVSCFSDKSQRANKTPENKYSLRFHRKCKNAKISSEIMKVNVPACSNVSLQRDLHSILLHNTRIHAQSRPQRPRSFWSAPRIRTSGIIHMKFRLKIRCDWLLYFTGSVIETGSFRIAIKQNARVKNMKMSL